MVAPKSGLNKNRGLNETDWTATYIFKYFYCNYLNILNLLLLRSKFLISSTNLQPLIQHCSTSVCRFTSSGLKPVWAPVLWISLCVCFVFHTRDFLLSSAMVPDGNRSWNNGASTAAYPYLWRSVTFASIASCLVCNADLVKCPFLYT